MFQKSFRSLISRVGRLIVQREEVTLEERVKQLESALGDEDHIGTRLAWTEKYAWEEVRKIEKRLNALEDIAIGMDLDA